MKPLLLSSLLPLLQDTPSLRTECVIKHVSNDITKLGSYMMVFHLNKSVALDPMKFLSYPHCYLVTDQALLNEWNIPPERVITVLNIETAYKKFVQYYRNLFSLPVVAVTGTCGKTTTKEMIAQVLRHRYRVAATVRSQNALRFNHEYLLSIDDSTQFGVFETGLTHPGNLISGCEYFHPNIGIITTIGIDHLNGCKTLDNYIRAKSEILAGLHNNGTLIINGDNEYIRKMNLRSFEGKVMTFGVEKEADFFGKDIQYLDVGVRFILVHESQEYMVYIPVEGEHNVMNALASLAALSELGMDLKTAIYAIGSFQPIRSHNQMYHGIHNSMIIDDTWSSNPTSVNAALAVLKEKGKGKTKIAVLGKINYLGEYAKHYYEQIAQMLLDYKVDYVITQDNQARHIGKHAITLGFPAKHVIHCKLKSEVKTVLESLLNEKSIALFKISMLDQSLYSVMKELILY